LESLDLLEEKLHRLMEDLGRWKRESDSMHTRLQDGEEKLSSLSEEKRRLSEENSRLLSEREAIRHRVRGLVERLEKLDLDAS